MFCWSGVCVSVYICVCVFFCVCMYIYGWTCITLTYIPNTHTTHTTLPPHSGKLGKQAVATFNTILARPPTPPTLRLSDIQHLPMSDIVRATNPTAGALLAALCAGRDEGPVQARGPQATLTSERSFPGVCTLAGIRAELDPLCVSLCARVLEVCMSVMGGCVWLFVMGGAL